MSTTPRTDAAYTTSVHDDGLRIDAMLAESEKLERERNILFNAITDAIARFDTLSWGWDGDCGSGNIMRDLEEARDKVCSSNPSHHDGAAPAPSVDGVVLPPDSENQSERK